MKSSLIRFAVAGSNTIRTELGVGQPTMERRQTMRVGGSRPLSALLILAAAFGASGCSGSLPTLPKIDELNPFKKPEVRLPGKRIPVMPASTSSNVGANLAPADQPIALASANPNTDWPQPGGTASNAPGHVVFNGTGRRVWRVNAGTGSSQRMRLSATPIVSGGRVFVLDARSVVRSFSASGGSAGWRAPLVPEGESAGEGFGGGLAADAGKVYAATGFGIVVALDPASGRKLWETNLRVPVRASPTAANGQVFVIAADGRVFALNGTDGSELWSFRGLPQSTRIISDPSPAVTNDLVVVPYPSGDLVALNASDGLPAWSDSLASTSATALGSMSDVSRPVLSNGIVYALGHSGRLVAVDAKTGERLWTQNIPGISTPAVSGSLVFVVNLTGQVMAIDGQTGQTVWTVKLKGASTWSGPTLASGKLWLTSNRGHLASVDAATGRVLSTTKVASKIYIAPIIAGGRMYVLADDASLMAFQ